MLKQVTRFSPINPKIFLYKKSRRSCSRLNTSPVIRNTDNQPLVPEERNPEWPASNCFKVENEDGDHYIIKHDPESDKWYLC